MSASQKTYNETKEKVGKFFFDTCSGAKLTSKEATLILAELLVMVQRWSVERERKPQPEDWVII